MSEIFGEVNGRKERPSFVRFERRVVEDVKASAEAGRFVGKDVDYALITAPYSKDIFHTKCDSWFAELNAQLQGERIPREWVEHYKKQYAAWKSGQEMPLNGTPIRGWGVISPAQQETLIYLGVLTVEDLAGINDEGMTRIGMGGVSMKQKAVGWLSQLNDKGPLTQEIASVKARNATLENSVESLQKQVDVLMAEMKEKYLNRPITQVDSQEITASDLLEDDPAVAYEAKFGKPPHHRMKPETILEALKA